MEKYGKPDDVMIGKRRKKEPLPPVPLHGMYNKHGNKVRLTFKMEQDQLWLGTKGIYLLLFKNIYIQHLILELTLTGVYDLQKQSATYI